MFWLRWIWDMSWHIKIRRGTIDQTASRNFRRKSRGSSQTRQGSVSHPKYKKKNHDAINLFIGKISVISVDVWCIWSLDNQLLSCSVTPQDILHKNCNRTLLLS